MSLEGYIDGASCLVQNDQRSDLKIAYGKLDNVAAVDTITTGLTVVLAAFASLEEDAANANLFVQAVVGDQSSTPAAGAILLKTWKPTANNNTTPVAATSFSKAISWFAIGY